MEGVDSRKLRPFLLDGIQETGEEIGRGSYGTVVRVKRWGTVCAAKRLHDLPMRLSSNDGRDMVSRFERECHLLSNLRHPNIVQFLGIYLEPRSRAPVLVMEYLPTSLSACLQARPQIPLFLQISMLHDVSLGLAYLHGHSPPIVHRDLTANNVLLTSNMVAKIGDLGVARMLDLNPTITNRLTQAPGAVAYMPPEALAPNPHYNTKIDSFSFGVLIIHLVSQQLPIPIEAVRSERGRLVAVSEAERRKQYLDLMGSDHCLLPLVVKCVQNVPTKRPEVSTVTCELETLQRRHPLPTKSYLDLLRVMENHKNEIEAKGVMLAANKEQLQAVGEVVETKMMEITELRERVVMLEKQFAGSLKGSLLRTNEDHAVVPSKDHSTSLVPTQTTFTWKCDADMPIGTSGARGIVLEDKVYIGGGDTNDLTTDRVVHEYDINGMVRKWTALPSCPVAYFAITAFNKSLVLVGGVEVAKKTTTNQLTVWDRGQQKWTSPFPPMSIPRQDATAITHQLWLIVAGGMNLKKPVNSVELFDCATYQWQTTRHLPWPCAGMSSCVFNNTWYLLGGTNFSDSTRGECGPQQHVCALKVDDKVSCNKWQILPDCPLYCSGAVAFGDFLVALGGTDSISSRVYSSAMFLFSPSQQKWLFIGNMPTTRSLTTCLVLSKGRLIVLGGKETKDKYSRTVELLYC